MCILHEQNASDFEPQLEADAKLASGGGYSAHSFVQYMWFKVKKPTGREVCPRLYAPKTPEFHGSQGIQIQALSFQGAGEEANAAFLLGKESLE